MSERESQRLALYNGLSDLLGSELADTLMTYLPSTESDALATKADVEGVRTETAGLRSEILELRKEIRHLSQMQQRQGQTMLAGFVTLFAAILATGFFG